jgi:exo-beta-1,3-glucanase (GH17 family)
VGKTPAATIRPICELWTVPQVDAAISSAKNHPQTVVGIVVGNEDMFLSDGTAVPVLQKRVVADIKRINNALKNLFPPVTVTTAQRDPDWYRLNQSDPEGVLSSVQVVGDNIYPFWGNSPEKVGGVSVASKTQTTAMNLKTALATKDVTDVIVTEEGWPSCGSNPNTQDKSKSGEIDYFHTWRQHVN